MTTDVYEASNSEITMFRRCPRKWWLSYIEKLAPKVKPLTGPLPLGSRVHAALEAYYKGEKGLLEAHADLVEADRYKLLMDGADISELDADADLGRIMLTGYLEWVETEGLDSDIEVLGSEEILKVPLWGGRMNLIGKLDLRIRKISDGMRLELDFKTAASFNLFEDTGHMSPQLKTYQLLDRLTNDPSERIEGGSFRLLKKVKRTARATPPFYKEMVIRHNEFTLRSFWVQLMSVTGEMIARRERILNGEDPNFVAPPNPTRDCRWDCPFFSICPLFDDGSDVDGAINDDFETVAPYAYYGDTSESERKS